MSAKETPLRLSPTKDSLNRLFAVSGNVCAFPGCDHPVFDEDFELVAQVCHIESAMPGGERFNKKSNNEARRKQENLMVMCLRHHVKTNNVLAYPTKKLREMKRDHEAQFLEKSKQIPIPPMAIDKAYDEIKRISEEILITVKGTDSKVDYLIAQNERLAAYVTTNIPVADNSPFKSEIDTIVSLRDNFNQQNAIDLFEKFREKNWDKLSPNEKFRTLANLGICYMETNRDKAAADLFIDALTYEPELLKAQSLASLGYTMKGDIINSELMIEKTLRADPQNVDAYQAMIHMLSIKGLSFEEIVPRIPESIRQQQEIAYALAFVARERGLLNDALTWLQIALENAQGQKADLTAGIANILLETINGESFVLNGTIDQPSKNKANLVIQYYDEAWNAISASSLRPSRSWWLVNRAVAKKFLGDRKAAYEDILEAWELNGDFWTSRHLAVAALEYGQKVKMWEALDKMGVTAVNEDEKRQTLLFIAEIDVAEGRREKGIAALEALLEDGLEEKATDYVRNKLVELYSTGGKIETAEALIDQLVKDRPEEVRTYLTQAQFLIFIGRKDEAKKSMEKARTLVNAATPAPEIHELAELFQSFNEAKQVAELIEMIADVKVYSRITRQLLMAYYEAGENSKLIKACEDLLAAYGPIDMVTELLSWAYEGLDDFENAIAVLTDYLAKYPDDQLIQSRLAFIYYRQRDREKLKALLSTVDHIDQTLPLEVQFKLARMFDYIQDHERFVKFAYEVRRNFYEEARAHDAFLSLSVETRQEESETKAPVTVTLNSAVSVSVNETNITYIIEDKEPLFASRGELSPDSPIGSALLGKSVGDVFTADRDGQSQEFKVLHVAEKFSYAFSESIQLLTTKFAAEAKTKKINLVQKADGQLDLEAFFAPLKREQNADQYIESVYKEQKMPIGVASSFKKISPIRSWAHYMASPDLGIFTTGPYPELVIAEKLIKAGKSLVLDILAITTLSSLNALDDISLLTNEKIVTRSTLEELNDLIREQESSSHTGTFTVGIIDGQYVKQVLSPETVQAQIEHLQQLADWVKANCTVVPTTAALKLNALEKQDLDGKLGKSFIDSILTAREMGCILYAEEMPLRGYAYVNYQVNGCATFIILRVLKELKLIDAARYHEKTLHLVSMNYKFIPADADILYLAAIKSKFELAFPLNVALEGLIAPMMLSGYETFEAVKFFYKLYAEKVTVILSADNGDYIETLVNATLDVLSRKFPSQNLEEDLMRKIDRLFMYIPIHQQNLRALTRKYFASRMP